MIGPTYIVAVEGLDALQYLDEIPESVKKNALRAVNATTRRGRTRASSAIRAQVAFTASYLSPSGGRLVAIPGKDKNNPEGIIRARTQPTSLARFTKAQPLKPGQRRPRSGIRLEVKPGVARYTDRGNSGLKGAFVIPLQAGKDGPLSNKGLAVRSETAPAGAYRPRKLADNLWLLYGPSVSQILYSARNQGGVADEIAPELATYLEDEFLRLMDVDLK